MTTREASRLIKARAAQSVASAALFNYDDLQAQCRQRLESAQRQAQELLDQARLQAQAIRQAARDEGFQEGRQAGLADAGEQIAARAEVLAREHSQAALGSALPALAKAVEELHLARDRWLVAWERAAVQLAICMAERITRCELERRPDLVAGTVREALQLAAGSNHLVLRLNPEDCALIERCVVPELARLADLGELRVQPDPAVSRGGCLLESDQAHVDARLEVQLERLATELLGSLEC